MKIGEYFGLARPYPSEIVERSGGALSRHQTEPRFEVARIVLPAMLTYYCGMGGMSGMQTGSGRASDRAPLRRSNR